jgi:polyferredoxin
MKKLKLLQSLQFFRRRVTVQILFFFVQNPFIGNFFRGRIHQGQSKKFCTPGLNCYSCPAALTSCPIGALQLFFAGVKFSMTLFVTGFLLCVGTVFGRFICGYVCPMGLLQDLLYKIKTPKLRLKLGLARYVKYAVLALLVIILPHFIRHELSGLGSPWFCAYVCPVGTIFGATPLIAANEFLQAVLGWRFVLKAAIAGIIIVSSLFVFRIFCRVLCPLGAIYALFNRFAIVRMKCDKDKCVSCGKCRSACHIQIDPVKQPNSPECVRCRGCVGSCNTGALR